MTQKIKCARIIPGHIGPCGAPARERGLL